MKTWALVVLISLGLPAMADREVALDAYARGDFATAFKQWQWLADEGDAEAEFRLGAMYEKGEGTAINPSVAATCYRKAADQAYAKAQYALGKLYADGRGILQDFVEAHLWLNLASANGEPEAAKLRDQIADKMTPGQVAEAQRLAKAWKPTGSQPSSTSPRSGGALRVGNGVSAPVVLYKVDAEYTEEARNAHIAGTVLLSLIVDATGHASDIRVLRGLGSGLDEKAVEAINKWKFKPGSKDGQPVAVEAIIEVNFRLLDPPPKEVAQQSLPPAASTAPQAETIQSKSPPDASDPSRDSHSYKALEAYNRGDYATAYREWLPLAEAGDSWAQIFIATIYYLGHGVTVDFEKAVGWIRKAADSGNPSAYSFLAACFWTGHGVPRDYVEAHKWLVLAVPSVPSNAAEVSARADVLAHLTPAERNKAQEMAFEWLSSKGFPFVTQPNDGSLVSTHDSLVHPVATSTRLIPEKGIQYKGVAVYATVTRDKGTLWSNVTVWNVEDNGEIGIDPNHITLLAGSSTNLLTAGATAKAVHAVPPAKAMTAGRTSATIQALLLSLGSNRRTTSYTGVDSTGNVSWGTVTYTDPELERQRAEAVQHTLDQQAANEQEAASRLLWPTVLKPTQYIRGGVEFHKVPKDATHIVLIVPVGSVMYNLPFAFAGKDNAGH